MRKVIQLFLIILISTSIISCSLLPEDNIKTPTPTPTETLTPTGPTDGLYEVNYYVDGELFYSEKNTYARNYNFLTDKLILGWFKTPDSYTNDNLYEFPTKIKSDVNLYAFSVKFSELLDRYFYEIDIISKVFLEQDINDFTNKLELKKTTEKIYLGGFTYQVTDGYKICFQKQLQVKDTEKSGLTYYEFLEWDFNSGNGIISVKYKDDTAGWVLAEYETIIFNAKFVGKQIAKNEYKFVVENYNVTDHEAGTEYVEPFIQTASAYLYMFVDQLVDKYYGGNYSNQSMFTKNMFDYSTIDVNPC